MLFLDLQRLHMLKMKHCISENMTNEKLGTYKLVFLGVSMS